MDFIIKHKTLAVVAVIVMVLIVVFVYRSNLNPGGNSEVVVAAPLPNEEIQSPLTVHGKARGTWFFEANLPVELLDADGNVVVQKGVQAEEDWMTADFVPFSVELTFAQPKTATGILRIKKDNPSGLPEHDASFDVPVRFGNASGNNGTMPVKVFFGSSVEDPKGLECNASYPVVRNIPKTQSVAQAAIRELLLGPTPEEKQKGYFTSLPDGVKLERISIADGVARAEFSEELDRTGGSCRVGSIRSQIVETIKQFPTVKDVVISIGGRTEDILQP
ncbi:MAG: hypothetical protein UY56_C0015G0003 [Parcubacteria group bacterium GW2011_GWA1_50_14]|uniref:GerMN domain-containing protein n=1 Tax=Candidatus Liptonbacteria bacterium GWB1_49_6 TaxID=1798644 RepID=A0A1G2C5F4_9BACT|nr:MAG: hypothetical protein UY56_C0015G0003 [Parcubacteria group bacterium GW2011_GWA1_50_14]OGY96371.1 MAG: hypothetical protein A2122_01355 [Candidatus Liptonbacteria bacterium GWB1_49_6]